MSIQNAMQAGVSGLFANGSRMSYVGNNIANSQTVGYKRQFADMVSMTAGGRQADSATTVRAVSRMDMLSQGTMMTTNRYTDLAVVGSGFFVVGLDTAGDLNTTGHRLSRAGNFRVNENGYMVNSAGHYLYGFAYDDEGNLGAVDRGGFRDLQAVNVGQVSMRGNATSRIEYSANLPAQQTGLADPPEPFVTSVEYFNSLGEAERLIFNWQPGADDQWELRVTDEASGTDFGTITANFHNSGANAGAPESYVDNTTADASFDVTAGVLELTIPNGTNPQVIEVELGAPDSFDRLTQFAGDYTPEGVRRNGSATASLSHVEVTDDGVLHGVFENGSRRALYQIPIAEVVNPEGLHEADGNAYTLGIEAGTMTLRESGGDKGYIASGVLERANVDLAQELTDLIEIQRAYSSNAKIVQTADEMLEETTRLKR